MAKSWRNKIWSKTIISSGILIVDVKLINHITKIFTHMKNEVKEAMEAAYKKGFDDGYAGNSKNLPSSFSLSDFLEHVFWGIATHGLGNIIKAMGGDSAAKQKIDAAYERGYAAGKRNEQRERKGKW